MSKTVTAMIEAEIEKREKNLPNSRERTELRQGKPTSPEIVEWSNLVAFDSPLPNNYPDRIVIDDGELLEDLQNIRNQLHQLDDCQKIVQAALCIIRKRLNCQVAAIFFLKKKDGLLHRFQIEGVDKTGFPVFNNWLNTEVYQVGHSLTVGVTEDEKRWATPLWWSKSVVGKKEPLAPEVKQEYIKKFGGFNCALAVPINGNSHPFGMIRVINKVNSHDKLIDQVYFSQKDIHWLSAITAYVEIALSSVRRNQQDLLALELT
jgi:hypothetical protein